MQEIVAKPKSLALMQGGLTLVMNGWWSCVHSYVLSAQGALFVWIQIFRPIVVLGACGGGGSIN
jgi:hypothetical protein